MMSHWVARFDNVKLSEERTSGKSSSSFLARWGAERKVMLQNVGWGPGEAHKMTDLGQSAWTKQTPLMSMSRLKCCKKSAPMGWILGQVGNSNYKPWIRSHRWIREEWYVSHYTPKANSQLSAVVGRSLGSRKSRHRGAGVHQEQTEYPSGRWGKNNRSTLEQKLEEWNGQVGWEVPPAGLLVFQHGTGFPAIDSLLSMFILEPTGSGRHQGSGGWSWSWRLS